MPVHAATGFQRIRTAVALLATFFLLNACATISDERLESVDRIVVISLLGDELRTHFHGTTIFNQEWGAASVKDWQIDQFVENEAGIALSRRNRFTIVANQADRQKLNKIYAECPQCRDRAPEYDIQKIEAEIAALAVNQRADAVILVLQTDNYEARRTPGNASIGGTNYGLDRRDFIGMKFTAVHAFVEIAVVDARTMEKMSSTAFIHEALIDQEHWHLDFEALPKASQDVVEAEIKELLRKGITDTLDRMSFM